MRNVVLLLFCLAAFAVAGWRLGIGEKFHALLASRTEEAEPAPRVKVPDDPSFGTYRDPITDEAEALHAEVAKQLAARDFAGLDALADEARAKRTRTGSGAWKLAEIYDALEFREKAADRLWQVHLRLLRDWQTARPLSITARVATANALTSYAWKARGSGFANTVTDEGSKLFQQRLAEAWKTLADARVLPTRDPHWWAVAQHVALGQEWPRANYEKLFAEAVELEPEYAPYYTLKAHFLLPRWYGKPGEWEKFAEESSQQPGGLGAEIYARIVLDLDAYHDHIFHDSKARWDLTKAGFQLMRERYPNSTNVLANFAVMAARGNDPKCAREVFDALGDRVDKRFWQSKDRYLYTFRYVHPEAR